MITSVGKENEKKEPYALLGMYIGTVITANSKEIPQMKEIQLPYDPAIPLLWIYIQRK